MSIVLFDRADGAATITLNRPDRLNAINEELLDAFGAILARIDADSSIRLIIVRGAGTSFCAGDDLAELAEAPPDEERVMIGIAQLQNISRRLMLGLQPVLCAVQGWAIGGGASWPLNADFTLWADDVRLRFPEALLGLFPSGGATWLLRRLCGSQRAQEIFETGCILDGEGLRANQIAEHTVACQALKAETLVRAQRLLSQPDEILREYKAARRQLLRAPVERALEYEARMLAKAFETLRETGEFPKIQKQSG